MSTALTLDQMDVFLAVVEAGSFSAAARALHRAQSAVSYAIARIEEELEVTLFDRSGRTPVLTPAGQALVGDVRAVRARVDDLVGRARVFSSGVEPRLAVAIDVFFPARALRMALQEFDARYPEVELVLYSSVMSETRALVLDGSCQVAVCGPIEVMSGELEKLEARELLDIELAPVVASTHRLAGLTGSVALSELRGETQIVLSDRGPDRDSPDRGVFSERVWRVADLHTKHEMISAGFGWGNMPRHTTHAAVESGELVEFELEGMPRRFRIPLWVIHLHGVPLGPAARWFVGRLEALVAHARECDQACGQNSEGESEGGGGGASSPEAGSG